MLKKNILLLIFGLSVLTGCASQNKDHDKRGLWHMQMGISHLKLGRTSQALSALMRAKELSPTSHIIINNLGLVYYIKRKYSLAEKEFRQAIVLKPKFTDAKANLGRTLIELKQYSEALKILKFAETDLVYTNPEKILTNLGLAYFHLNKFEQAKKIFKKALQISRKNCIGWNFYGRSLFELAKFKPAASSLDTAIQECKKIAFSEPYFFAALSYLKLGQREKSLARLEEGLHKAPEGAYAKKISQMIEILR